MNFTRTRVARALMVGATAALMTGLWTPALVAAAEELPEPPTSGASAAPTGGATLADLAAISEISGFIGPIELPSGTSVALLTRPGDAIAMTGSVELAVEAQDGWHIEQVLKTGYPASPIAFKDLTGDGRPEIVVTMVGSIGGRSMDVVYTIDEIGPIFREIPFAVDELAELGIRADGLTVDEVRRDYVRTTVSGSCRPSCAEDVGESVEWWLDRSGEWILRPQFDYPMPGPINFESPLLWGYEANVRAVAEYYDPAQLAVAAQTLSRLTGWHWRTEMVIALGASYCNGWETETLEDGTVGGVTKSGKQSWALSVGPVLGVDAEAARIALDSWLRDQVVDVPQLVCQ